MKYTYEAHYVSKDYIVKNELYLYEGSVSIKHNKLDILYNQNHIKFYRYNCLILNTNCEIKPTTILKIFKNYL